MEKTIYGAGHYKYLTHKAMYLGDIFGDTYLTINVYCLRLPVLPNRLYSIKSTVISHFSTNPYNAEL